MPKDSVKSVFERLRMDVELRAPGLWNIDQDLQHDLDLYLARVAKVRRLGLFPFPVNARVGFNEQGLFAEAELPDERLLESAVLRIRPFLLEGEPTNLKNLSGRLYRATTEPRFHEKLEAQGKCYKQFLREELNPSHPEIRTTEELTRAYFYGDQGYFHSDRKGKAASIVPFDAEEWGPMHKRHFAQALHGLAGFAYGLVPIVRNALGHDLLAPCSASKRIQELLTGNGLGPTPITIHEVADGSRSPLPKLDRIRADLHLHVPEALVEVVLTGSLTALMEELPGYKFYGVARRTECGDYVFNEVSVSEPNPRARSESTD